MKALFIFINDKLVQVEKYQDMKVNVDIDNSIFNPENFIKLTPGSYKVLASIYIPSAIDNYYNPAVLI